ncbi:hypothetical protein [Paractinoplanes durhamensis]|uniref:Uncharacterized protein n=1 Tax=Paractinoplanes durhamensis TaxID=113563 RepID=A0ABQ3YQC0_9ACTN|nr:hypothetical protein [Actinoplanes durhamensis]GID99785.1 hypothetical protein Adu01nite_11360 [Actinoplanes durhamensis]
MPTLESSYIQIFAYVLVMVLCAYGGGRVHQWYKHSMDRDQSFRDGYNQGYHALFALAARHARPAAAGPAAARPAPIEQRGKDELIRD